MEKLNRFEADSIWIIFGKKRTLKEWAEFYRRDLDLVQLRLRNGWSLQRALRTKKRQERVYKQPTLEELKEMYSKPKPIVFDAYEPVEKITFTDAAKEREKWAFRLMYGKDNINQLTTY